MRLACARDNISLIIVTSQTNANASVKAAKIVPVSDIYAMSTSLRQFITVVPLQKPRDELWSKRKCERERATQITEVLEKLKEADHRKSFALSSPGRDKDESENRITMNSLKGFARESPG